MNLFTKQSIYSLLFSVFIVFSVFAKYSFPIESVDDCAMNPFVTHWKTDNPGGSNDSTIYFPLVGADFQITWEDVNGGGNGSMISSGPTTISFDHPGTYIVSVSGGDPALNRVRMDLSFDKQKLIAIESWGDIQWSSMQSAFFGCTNMVYNAINSPDLSAVSDCSSMFMNCNNFDASLANWDISHVSSMDNMLDNTSISIENYDSTLLSWSLQMVQSNVTLGAEGLSFCQSVTARQSLIDDASWQISDDNFSYSCLADYFIATFDPSKIENNRIRIYGEGTNFTIYWEEIGNEENRGLINGNDGENIVVLPNNNMYSVYIGGGDPAFHRLNYNNSPYAEDLIEVVDWGNVAWSTMNNAFYGCSNLLKVPKSIPPDLSITASCQNMFRECTSFDTNINFWDVSTVEVMNEMFYNASSFNSILNTWEVDQVTEMRNMFRGASTFSRNLGNWNVTNVEKMGGMFRDATAFNGDVTSWIPSSAQSMGGMFFGATNFNQNISAWNTMNVIFFNNMFREASSFDQDISNWNTLSATTMQNMFNGATSFDQNLGNLVLNTINNMDNMLANCGMSTTNYDNTLIGWQLQTVPASITLGASGLTFCHADSVRNLLLVQDNWTINGDMLVNQQKWYQDIDGDGFGDKHQFIVDCVSPPGYVADSTDCNPTEFDGRNLCLNDRFATTWKTDNEGISADNEIFIQALGTNYTIYWEKQGEPSVNAMITANNDQSISFPSAGVYDVYIDDGVGNFDRFYFTSNMDNKKLLSVNNWGTILWTSFEDIFSNCTNMVYNATDIPSLSQVTSMNGAFQGCTNFNGNIDDWDVSSINSMEEVFYKASSFNQSLNSWDVDSVTTFFRMFREASSFNGAIDQWELDNAETIQAMFFGASSFNQDLRDWDVSHIDNMSYAFDGAISFAQPLDSWDITHVTTMLEMLDNTALSAEQYDTTIIAWSNLALQNDVPFGASGLLYCRAIEERVSLETNFNWTITKDKIDTSCLESYFIAVYQLNLIGNNPLKIPVEGSNYHIYWEQMGNEFSNNGWLLNNTDDVSLSLPFVNHYFYRVYIEGGETGIHRYNNDGDINGLALKEILDWGDVQWSTMEGAFSNCRQLANVPTTNIPDLSTSVSTRRMFQDCLNFNSDLNSWDVSTIEDMSLMFNSAVSFNTDIGDWNVASVQDFNSMFDNALSFNQNLSDWNTTSAIHMNNMFYKAYNFDQDLSSFHMSSVSTVDGMLSYCNMSKLHYDNTLISWEAQDVLPNLTLGAIDLGYCLGSSARSLLISQDNWQINGDTLAGQQKWFIDSDGDGYGDPTQFIFDCIQPIGYVSDSTDCNPMAFDDRNLCLNKRFATTWKTDNPGSSDSNKILINAIGQNYQIYWEKQGEPTINGTIISSNNQVITFPEAGIYNVYIDDDEGSFSRFFFLPNTDSEKLISVDNWGEIVWSSLKDMFHSCINMYYNATDSPNLSQVSSMNNTFEGCINFNGDIDNWDVSYVNNMSFTFEGATSFSQSLASWDISQVTTMSDMLNNTGLTKDQYESTLEAWSSLTVQTNVMLGAEGLEYCEGSIARQKLINNASWQFMNDVFVYDCLDGYFSAIYDPANFENQRIRILAEGTDFNIYWEEIGNEINRGVTIGNDGVTVISLPSNNPYLVFIGGGFPAFHRLNYNNSPHAQDIVEILDWGNIQWSTMANALYGASNLTEVSKSISPDLSSVTTCQNMFRGCTSFNTNINFWDMSHIENMNEMFFKATSFNSPLFSWNVDQVTEMRGMFREASSFSRNLENWNVSSVTNMATMFRDAISFNGPITSWTPSAVKSMAGMFYGATSFNSDISAWNVSNVELFINTFRGSTSFNQDISGWNTQSALSMQQMFYEATNFDHNVGAFSLSSVNNINDMFSLSGISTVNYDNTLIGWEAQNVPQNLILGSTNLTFCNAVIERNNLISADGWQINGDQLADSRKWFLDSDGDGFGDSTHFVFDCAPPSGYVADSTDCNPSEYDDRNLCLNERFATTWKTDNTGSSNNNQILINAVGQNYNIYWEKEGEPAINGTMTSSNNQIITFPTIGTYHVYMSDGDGSISRFFFLTNTDSNKLISIDNWGKLNWSSMKDMFRDCSNMIYHATDIPDLSQVNSMNSMFKGCSNFDGDIDNWDVSNVTSMEEVFYQASSFNQSLNSWDVDSVTTFFRMFRDATSFNGAVDQWQLDSAQTLQTMFFNATSFNQNLSNWDVSHVDNMSYTFDGATSFAQSLASWDISQVTTMFEMLDNTALSIEQYDSTLIAWSSLTVQPNVNLGAKALQFCKGISARDVLVNSYSWTIEDDSFSYDCFTGYFQAVYDPSIVENQRIRILGEGTNFTIYWEEIGNEVNNRGAVIANNGTSIVNTGTNQLCKVYIGGGEPAFHRLQYNNSQYGQEIIEVLDWGNIAWSSMQNAFYGCTNLIKVPKTIAPDLSSVTNCQNMFRDCSSFNTDINIWDVSNIENMNEMFYNAASFNGILSNWNVGKVMEMRGMFRGASSFSRDLNNWNVSAIFRMGRMFQDATSFNGQIANWNTINVESLNNMFQGATNFNRDISSWNVDSVRFMNNMFAGASNFDHNLANWNIAMVTNINGMLSNCGMSIMNYDSTLISWSGQNVKENLSLGADGLIYCGAFAQRQELITDKNWTITADTFINTCLQNQFIMTMEPLVDHHNSTTEIYSTSMEYSIFWEKIGEESIHGAKNGSETTTITFPEAGQYRVYLGGATFDNIHCNNQSHASDILAIESWGDIHWSTMLHAFSGCNNLTTLPMSPPDLSEVSVTTRMFNGCSNLNADISTWDVSNVNYMAYMFQGCVNFNSSLDNWVVDQVLFMNRMFSNCWIFNQPLASWNTGNVLSMEGMFFNTFAFEQSLASWDISKVSNMTFMLQSSNLSVQQYDSTLISWSQQEVKHNIIFHANTIQYCKAGPARDSLMINYDWIINDENSINFVSITSNDGQGSLRNSVNSTCDEPVTFNPSLSGFNINLLAPIILPSNKEIQGLGMNNTIINGQMISQLFEVNLGDTLILKDISLINGNAPVNGGAIWNKGLLKLFNVSFSNNSENFIPKAMTNVGEVEVLSQGEVIIE